MTTKTNHPTASSIVPFYPFLIGLFPVLYLWSANREQVPAYVIIPPLLVTLAGLLALYLAAFALLRSPHRAALLTAVVSFPLLTYGQFANLIKAAAPELDPAYPLIASGVLLLVLVVTIILFKLGSPALTKTMNVVAIIMVLVQLIFATPYYLQVAQLTYQTAQASADDGHTPVTGPGPQRDVYFILIDNYGRQDDLQERFNFDNSELMAGLKARGFILPDCAQGNYFWTAPAISSILNMNYLDQLGIDEANFTRRGKYGKMAPLIQDSEVLRNFKAYGYHTVTFRGFMGLIDIQNSDTYIDSEKDRPFYARLETHKFQSLYWDTTLFAALNKEAKVYPDLFEKYASTELEELVEGTLDGDVLAPEFRQVYEQNIHAFDSLERIPSEVPGPKFVYAHLYTAHWPFMLRPDGSLRLPFTQKLTPEGYVDGVRYTNSRILGAIDAILANSETEPVIILQSDHSNGWVGKVEWSGTDRVKILSAYYLPGGGEQALYDTISPVNNFRLVFQQYFGEDIDLLPDVNYYLNPTTRKMDVAPSTCISSELK